MTFLKHPHKGKIIIALKDPKNWYLICFGNLTFSFPIIYAQGIMRRDEDNCFEDN